MGSVGIMMQWNVPMHVTAVHVFVVVHGGSPLGVYPGWHARVHVLGTVQVAMVPHPAVVSMLGTSALLKAVHD